MPFARIISRCSGCVPAFTFTSASPPSVGTVTIPPNMAVCTATSTLTCTSLPFRSNRSSLFTRHISHACPRPPLFFPLCPCPLLRTRALQPAPLTRRTRTLSHPRTIAVPTRLLNHHKPALLHHFALSGARTAFGGRGSGRNARRGAARTLFKALHFELSRDAIHSLHKR